MNQKEEEALITHHVLKRHIKNGRHLSTIIRGVVTTIDVFLVEGLGRCGFRAADAFGRPNPSKQQPPMV